MPFVTMYLREGCDNAAIERSMAQISQAGADIMENTLLRMVRVSVYEIPGRHIYDGGKPVAEGDIAPTVFFDIGPGRSEEAKTAFMDRIAQILHENLGVPKEKVRAYVEDTARPQNFCIDGVVKDFSKKVK